MAITYGVSLNDYSAMQGPCPNGWHIPLKTEFDGIISILSSLGSASKEQAMTNLHMPPMGCREGSNAAISFRDRCYYWSSSPQEARYPDSATILCINYNGMSTSGNVPPRSRALPIRAFKNEYITPTSNWTVIAGTLGSAGIFWDQTNGLISITNGSNKNYTMQDKNLGATTVYNYGDSMTENNMGKMYQRGNNYGFPSTGNITTTSSTKVNASTYGPGTTNGYYESSTYITTSGDWSSPHNNNLWGGLTGIQQRPLPINNITLGNRQVTEITLGSVRIWPELT